MKEQLEALRTQRSPIFSGDGCKESGSAAPIFGKKRHADTDLKDLQLAHEERRVICIGQSMKGAFRRDQAELELREQASCCHPIVLPFRAEGQGGLHPTTQMCYDLNDAQSFSIFIAKTNLEHYAFDVLIPARPSRAETMDPYWISGGKPFGQRSTCLRPHLTGASVRYLQQHSAPARFVYPGPVFETKCDAQHGRAFYQYEALIVDRDFSFSSDFLSRPS